MRPTLPGPRARHAPRSRGLRGSTHGSPTTARTVRPCDSRGRPSASAVRVSDDLYRVLSLSLAMSSRTGGAFDVTVGPLSHVWRRARRQSELPDAREVDAARAASGSALVQLDAASRSVKACACRACASTSAGSPRAMPPIAPSMRCAPRASGARSSSRAATSPSGIRLLESEAGAWQSRRSIRRHPARPGR